MENMKTKKLLYLTASFLLSLVISCLDKTSNLCSRLDFRLRRWCNYIDLSPQDRPDYPQGPGRIVYTSPGWAGNSPLNMEKTMKNQESI